MASYPPVTDTEADAALRRIRTRHEHREDPHWWQAEADGPQAHYRALDYLRRRSQPGPTQLPAGLAATQARPRRRWIAEHRPVITATRHPPGHPRRRPAARRQLTGN